MRLLVEILVVGALIYLGWEQPFKERANQVRAAVTSKQAAVAQPESTAAPAAPTPTPIPQPRPMIRATPPPGAWRTDPNHRSVLDRPAYDQTQPSQRYQDASGRTYWIDAQGVRHYD